MIGELDLSAEFVAARDALTPEHKRHLKAAGVPSIAFAYGLVGVARIEIDEDKFHLEPNGRESFVVPVRVDPEAPVDVDHPAPSQVVALGDPIDLVAFDPERPDWFAVMTGEAPVLGAALHADAEPTVVWRSPLAWLQAKCRGVVALTTNPIELRAILERLPGGITAQDLEHAREIEAAFKTPKPTPRIYIHKARAA
jgi:hypothetical protein